MSASSLATLNLISGGRMVLGIGRGDNSRRVLGQRPTTLAALEEVAPKIRGRIGYWSDGGWLDWLRYGVVRLVNVLVYGLLCEELLRSRERATRS